MCVRAHAHSARALGGTHAAAAAQAASLAHNALHAAAAMKYTHDASRFVEMLLALGADPTIPEPGGETALDIAEANARAQDAALAGVSAIERRNYEGVIRILREHA